MTDDALRQECAWLLNVHLRPMGHPATPDGHEMEHLLRFAKQQQAEGVRSAAQGVADGLFIPKNYNFNISEMMLFTAWVQRWCEATAKALEE